MDMQRGMRDKLDKYVNTAQPIEVTMEANGAGTYQFCCFGVDSQKKLSDDRYMIFHNQQQSPDNEITTKYPSSNAVQFTLQLDRLPASIDRLVLTASADGNATMSQLSSLKTEIGQNGSFPLCFAVSGSDFNVEKAVIMLEIYRKDGWRVMAVARGMQGGLRELLASYGGEKALDIKPIPVPEPPKPQSSGPSNAAGSQSSSSGKVILKKGQKVNLKKSGAAAGQILINLNWSQPAPKRGLFGFKNTAIDLDLGCLYEMMDGTKGCVQALGKAFGSLQQVPYIALDADDRSGASTTGENLRINEGMIGKMRRVLIYTFIYDGIANWAQADGVVTVKCPGNPEIIVHMDEYGSKMPMCAIAMLENDGSGTFSIEKLVQFFQGHEPMDRAYNWGMRWVKGRK